VRAVQRQLKKNKEENEQGTSSSIPLTAIPSSPSHTTTNETINNNNNNNNSRIVRSNTDSSQNKQGIIRSIFT